MAWWTREQPATIADYPHRASRSERRNQHHAERDNAAAAKRHRDHHRHARQADRAGQAWEAHDRNRYGG